jgi:hypothetical protein
MARSRLQNKWPGEGGSSSQHWKTFVCNHADGIASIDMFVVPTISFPLLQWGEPPGNIVGDRYSAMATLPFGGPQPEHTGPVDLSSIALAKWRPERLIVST